MVKHVPEVERKARVREEDGQTCARSRAKSQSTGRRWLNMCPKSSKKPEYGKKMIKHVPEIEPKARVGEEDDQTCARS